MMKMSRSVEAVDVADTFGVEQTFHPQRLWQFVVAGCGRWVAAVLWLFVVLFEVGMWWMLRWVCGGGCGGWFFFFFFLIRVAVVFWCV